MWPQRSAVELAGKKSQVTNSATSVKDLHMTPDCTLFDAECITALLKLKDSVHVCNTSALSGTTSENANCAEQAQYTVYELALLLQQLNDKLLVHAASVMAAMKIMEESWNS